MLFFVFLAIAIINFLFGVAVATGFYAKLLKLQKFDEELTYCHGYEDGLYYAIGEHTPELFDIQIAQRAYKEYKGLKHGPTRH